MATKSLRSRRGSFGLKPRVVPDITNQIVALAREYVAKRDALIMDAWRNGGTFEGKKATDEMVLAYWAGRSKDLSKDDPEYEQAQDQIMQLQYGIAQSKADVLHTQGKLSDSAYAQFFINWAKKVPVDSEFYRTLQKDAAQLIESAKAKGRASSEAAKTKSFNDFVHSTTAKDIAIGDAMTTALTDLSKQTGLSVTGNGDELLTLLTQNVKANPDEYRRLLDTIKAGDPSWNGQLTEGYFNQHIKAATDGYTLIADRAQKDGYVSAYASATQGMASMSQWGQNLKVWPVAESYSVAENAWAKVMSDPNSSQMDKLAASTAFSASLNKLAGSAGIDEGSKTMLTADAQRLIGQDAGDSPSFGTAMLGRPGVDAQSSAILAALTKTKTEMDANPTAWAYAPVDANGQFDPTGRGSLGMVPAGQVQPGAQAVMIPGANGSAVMAMVMPHSVFVTDPNNPTGSPKLAGYQISYNVGGRTVQMWGYKDVQGSNHWSLVSPLAEGAATTVDNKGDVYVSPQASPATDPIARAAQLDSQLGTHIADQLKQQQAAGSALGASVTVNTPDAQGHDIGSITLTYSNGAFTATQTQNTLTPTGHVLDTQTTPLNIAVTSPQQAAFSQSRLAAGDVPGITYNSPLDASVKAASYTQTQDQVNRYASDPAFQQAFLSQTMQTLGTSNPLDPRIATAWQSVTTSAEEVAARHDAMAQRRDDLSYPGGTTTAPTQDQLSIKFGHPELTIPGVPSGSALRDSRLPSNQDIFSGVRPQLLPGLGAAPAQTAAGSPAPVVAPTPTVTPTPTPVTTTVTPVPVTLAPTPTAAPAPAPAPFGYGPRPV